MVALINFASLVLAMALYTCLYILSVRPAALERKTGPSAYRICARYRMAAMLVMFVAVFNYAVYYFFPLPLPIPQQFPWSWWVSALAALVLAVPSGYLFTRGILDAGEETLIPKKKHSLFKGIYRRIRHPQAWEALFWFVLAFLLHSPFLVLFSLAALPLEYGMLKAEERDLAIRFGTKYEEYRQHTGAFLPKRGK